MKVNPVPGRLVRNPATGLEVREPVEVPDTDPFWLRRLADGDVALAGESVTPPRRRAVPGDDVANR